MQTIVRTIRVNKELWDRLGERAKAKGKTRNGLIAEVLAKDCVKKSKNSVDKEKQV